MSTTKASSAKVNRSTTPKKVAVLEPAVSETPVPETPRKKVATKAVSAPLAPVVEDPAVPEPAAKKVNPPLEDILYTINDVVLTLKDESQYAKTRKDKELASTLNQLAKSLNALKKPIDKLARSKPPRKQINIDENRNGFLMPLEISPELAKFLGCPVGTKKSRVDVTRAICNYIAEKKLQNPDNRREIVADAVLQKLLKYDPAVETKPLQYFMIQTRIQSHFIKSSPS
jgi:chromatin remodeling complex protein RSC6